MNGLKGEMCDPVIKDERRSLLDINLPTTYVVLRDVCMVDYAPAKV